MNPLVIACTISFSLGVTCAGIAVMVASFIHPHKPATPEPPLKALDLDTPEGRRRFLDFDRVA